MTRKRIKHETPIARADELFKLQQDQIYRKTDQLFAQLLFWQWIGCIIMAMVISPRTWAGQTSAIHVHVWASIFLGGALSIFPIWLTRAWPGAAITRHVIAVAQMLMSALLISVTGGRIETHFHVFGSLVILSFYRDWRVLVPATIVVALDHFIRGVYWPYSVYGVLTASPWRSVEHAAWVIFEDVFLVISCFRSMGEMRSIAKRTAALEQSEQNSRQIFQEAPIGMAVVGLDEKFLQANSELCQMFDYSEDEMRKLTPHDITYADDVESSREIARSMLRGGSGNRFEKRYVRKDGEIVWAARTGCVIRDETGNPRHFLIMIEDISKQKHAEEALHESKRELEAAVEKNQVIMDNSLDVICTIDEEGRFLTVNAACEDLWGYKPDELIGRKYMELVDPADQARTRQTESDLKITNKVTDFVNRYIRKDGTTVDVLWSATWSENAKTFFGVAHDVTERAKMEAELKTAKEEADRANHAKSDFLSRMSHELRTPLNAILGFGQLLERQSSDDAQKGRVSHIMNAGRHLLNLINEILDIARVESGRLQLSLEPVSVELAVDEAIDLIRPLATERKIQINRIALNEKSPSIQADRQRLKQILLNLLANAVKYNRHGGRIIVDLAPQPEEHFRISVIDEGPGIPADKRSRLFSPFDRLDAEESEVQGSGLGLALCKRLTEAMGGKIGEGGPAMGACFWIEFPIVKDVQEQLASSPVTPEAFSKLDPGEKTLLYIEDNLSNLSLVEHLLRECAPIKLISAMQGKLGLELATQHEPDLILLDIHLPDINGREVLARLKARAATRDIPVVVLSADATKTQINRLMALGAAEYLTKPLEVDRFLEVIEHHFCEPAVPATNGSEI